MDWVLIGLRSSLDSKVDGKNPRRLEFGVAKALWLFVVSGAIRHLVTFVELSRLCAKIVGCSALFSKSLPLCLWPR